jgi:hypothetical protein
LIESNLPNRKDASPFNWLSLTSTSAKFAVVKEEGSVPVRRFPVSKRFKMVSVEGMVPMSMLPSRRRNVSSGKRPMEGGIGP